MTALIAPLLALALGIPWPPAAPPPPWDALADCESGDWHAGDPVPGTARWNLPPRRRIFEGGLQFHPDTWDAFRDPDDPTAAHLAPRTVQIRVAARVLDAQGWGAWPVCSRMLELHTTDPR